MEKEANNAKKTKSGCDKNEQEECDNEKKHPDKQMGHAQGKGKKDKKGGDKKDEEKKGGEEKGDEDKGDEKEDEDEDEEKGDEKEDEEEKGDQKEDEEEKGDQKKGGQKKGGQKKGGQKKGGQKKDDESPWSPKSHLATSLSARMQRSRDQDARHFSAVRPQTAYRSWSKQGDAQTYALGDKTTTEDIKRTLANTISAEHEHVFAQSLPADYSPLDGTPCLTDYAARNQGSCGSCYAFAATTALALQACVVKHRSGADASNQPMYTVQGLVSCGAARRMSGSSRTYTGGCNGGNGGNTFQYIIDHGVASVGCWPYQQSGGSFSNHFNTNGLALAECRTSCIESSCAPKGPKPSRPLASTDRLTRQKPRPVRAGHQCSSPAARPALRRSLTPPSRTSPLQCALLVASIAASMCTNRSWRTGAVCTWAGRAPPTDTRAGTPSRATALARLRTASLSGSASTRGAAAGASRQRASS